MKKVVKTITPNLSGLYAQKRGNWPKARPEGFQSLKPPCRWRGVKPSRRGGGQPLRIKVRPVKLGELDFKPLVPKLKFITNKKRWSGHLMGKAMREIPEEDYRLIEGLL